MKTKLAGFVLLAGMSLAAHAASFNFTPITDSGTSVLQNLGRQLTLEVTQGGTDDVLFTFRNNGPIESSISRVYFDDAPSNLFSSFSVANQSPGVNFTLNADPPTLTDGAQDPFRFWGTDSAESETPRFNNGVNHSAEVRGEFLTLSGVLNAGRSFADVVTSLGSGPTSQGNLLRVGLRVIGINQFNDSGSASFLDTGPGSGPTAPIPESSTFGMLLAGLGLITAIARRRQSGR